MESSSHGQLVWRAAIDVRGSQVFFFHFMRGFHKRQHRLWRIDASLVYWVWAKVNYSVSWKKKLDATFVIWWTWFGLEHSCVDSAPQVAVATWCCFFRRRCLPRRGLEEDRRVPRLERRRRSTNGTSNSTARDWLPKKGATDDAVRCLRCLLENNGVARLLSHHWDYFPWNQLSSQMA